MDRAVANHRAQLFDLVDLAVDEFLPAKTGVDGHHADQVDHIQKVFGLFGAGRGIERKPRLGPQSAGGLQRAVDMRSGLQMRGDHIGARLGIGLKVLIYRRNHQMHIHHGFDMRADRFDQRRAEGKVRHEMPVHHIDMDPITALGLDGLDFLAKVGEIRRQDRGGDFDRTVKAHGRPLVRYEKGARRSAPPI